MAVSLLLTASAIQLAPVRTRMCRAATVACATQNLVKVHFAPALPGNASPTSRQSVSCN